MKKLYYLESFKSSADLAEVAHAMTGEQFAALEQSARDALRALPVSRFGLVVFDNFAFISSGEIHGFWNTGKTTDSETGARLVCVAYRKKWKPAAVANGGRSSEYIPLVVLEKDTEAGEQFYILKEFEISTAPLAEWKKTLERRAQEAREDAEALRNITRATKKGGGNFANLQKNINGAKIEESNGDRLHRLHIRATGYPCYRYFNIYLSHLNGGDGLTIDEFFNSFLPSKIEEYEEDAQNIARILENANRVYYDVMLALYEKLLKYGTPCASPSPVSFLDFLLPEWIQGNRLPRLDLIQ